MWVVPLGVVHTPCRSRTRSSPAVYSWVQCENARTVSSRPPEGVISSPVLLLYFMKSPLMFLSTVNQQPSACHHSRQTSRNLGKPHAHTRSRPHAHTHVFGVNSRSTPGSPGLNSPERIRNAAGFHLVEDLGQFLSRSLLLDLLQEFNTVKEAQCKKTQLINS